MIAVLSIVSGGKLATAFIVLALPIIDGFWVILRRIYERKSPFKGDLWHFHHRLLYLGLSERQVLAVYYAFTLTFAGVALMLESFWKLVAILCLFLLISTAELLFYYKQNKLAKK
jgi:UDP-GlcNAc:undecaprenyl-phosphate GlcNAc-1-phosphate transferase